MILVRAALFKLTQTFLIGALSVGVFACFLLSYSYLGGDRQDRAEMQATATHVIEMFESPTGSLTLHGQTQKASLSSIDDQG